MAKFVYDDIIQEMAVRRQQDEAFAEALKALFDLYRVPGQVSQVVKSARSTAVRSAANGAYRSAFYPREASKAWKVPPDQLRAIHALVYG